MPQFRTCEPGKKYYLRVGLENTVWKYLFLLILAKTEIMCSSVIVNIEKKDISWGHLTNNYYERLYVKYETVEFCLVSGFTLS